VTNNQFVVGNNPAINSSIFGFDVAATTAPVNSGRGLAIFGRNGVTGGVHIGVGGEAFVSTSGQNELVRLTNPFIPSSGNATYTMLRLTPSINQTGGANGITRGIFLEPTLTSAADWRSFDTSVNSGFAYHSSGSAPSRLGGNLTIETDVVSNAAYTASTPTAGTNRQIHYRFMRTSADFLASLTAAWRGGTASNRVNLEFYAGGDASNPPMTVRGSANSSFVALGSNYQLVWTDTTNSSTGTANLGIQRAGDGIMLLMANNEFRFQNLGATSWTPMRCGVLTSAFQTLSADPSTIDIPAGSNRIVKNTTSGEVRDWVNDGGVMKKSSVYT
jgi:hypothetical protein